MDKACKLRWSSGKQFPGLCLLDLIDCLSCQKDCYTICVLFLIAVGGQQHTWTKGKWRGRLSSEWSTSPNRGGRGGSLTLSGSRAQASEDQACSVWPARRLTILKKTSQVESSIQREVPMSTITYSICMPQISLFLCRHSFIDSANFFTLLSKACV